MKRRFAFVIIVLILLTVFVACGRSQETEETTDTNVAIEESRPVDDERLFGFQTAWDNHGLSTDPITLTIVNSMHELPHQGIIDNTAMELIREATGITLDWIGADEERFAVMIAGGDLPDIILSETGNSRLFGDLIASGALLNMEPLLERYGGNINRLYDGLSFEFIRHWTQSHAGRDGIYFLNYPITNIGDYEILTYNGADFGLFVRYDIYAAIGSPPIMDENGFNEDMLLDVLRQMQDHARNEMGISNAFAISGWMDWGPGWTVMHPFQFIFGRVPIQYHCTLTGEILGSFTDRDHPTWDFLRFYNNAFRMGIFDPEAFILTWEQYGDRVNSGEIITTNGDWWFSRDEINDTFPDAGLFRLRGMPYIEGLRVQNNPIGFEIFGARAINVNNPHPERTVALFDYVNSDEFLRTIANGLQGIEWDYDANGFPEFIGDRLAMHQGDPAAMALYADGGIYDYFVPTKLWAEVRTIHSDGFPTDFTLAPFFQADQITLNPALRLFLETEGAGPDIIFPGQLYMEWVNEGITRTNAPVNPNFSFQPAAPENITLIFNSINTFIMDNQARLILADTEAEFESILDSIIAELITMGEQQLFENTMERFEESMRIAEELVGR